MFEFSTRQKCVGIATVAILVGVGVGLGFGGSQSPSPRDARAALAESGICSPDAPIVELNGLVLIGNVKCDLPGRSFDGWGKFEYRQNDDFLSRNISWTPFSRWVAVGFRKWSGPIY